GVEEWGGRGGWVKWMEEAPPPLWITHRIGSRSEPAIQLRSILLQLRQVGHDRIFPRIGLHPCLLFKLCLGPERFGDNQLLSLCFDLASFGPKLIAVGFNGRKINLSNLHRPEPTIACCVTKVGVFVRCRDEYPSARPINSAPTVGRPCAVNRLRGEQLHLCHIALMQTVQLGHFINPYPLNTLLLLPFVRPIISLSLKFSSPANILNSELFPTPCGPSKTRI